MIFLFPLNTLDFASTRRNSNCDKFKWISSEWFTRASLVGYFILFFNLRRIQWMVKTSICLHTLKSMSVIRSLNLAVSLLTFSFSRQHKYLCLFFDLFYQLGIFSSLKVLVSSNLIFAYNYPQPFSLTLWPVGFTAGIKTQASPDFLFCNELNYVA